MPTLAVGIWETRENYDMPTASVGMAPFPGFPQHKRPAPDLWPQTDL